MARSKAVQPLRSLAVKLALSFSACAKAFLSRSLIALNIEATVLLEGLV